MLKDKIDLLRSFDLFSKLSDSNLSLVSYSMQEEVFHRDQVVYREGIDTVDKMYLIKTGEFQLCKTIIKPVDKTYKLFTEKDRDIETKQFNFDKFK